MAKKLEEMTVKELTAHIEEANMALEEAKKRAKNEALERMLSVASELGVSIDEVFPRASAVAQDTKPKQKRTKTPSKKFYVHPSYPGETYSGAGRPPQWYSDLKKSGEDMEKFNVNAQKSEDEENSEA